MWMEACEETLQELWNADFMKKVSYPMFDNFNFPQLGYR